MNATDLQRFVSPSAQSAKRNEIRELLKLISRPEIISLAGGLPSPDTFPLRELAEMLPSLLERHGTAALQYGTTEGDPEFRRVLVELMIEVEGSVFSRLSPDHILVTSASQQALDLCCRVFIAPGDVVICGLPSYLGALGAFTACGARLSGIPLDDEGLRTDILEQRLIELRRRGVHPKLLYTVPDFQNPSGVTLGLRRREELLAIAREFDLLVVEDSPYRQLRYVGDPQPSLASLDRDARVISLFTFSKILSPGLRLGWVVASPEIIRLLVVAKQPIDLCTSGLVQLIGREFLRAGLLNRQIARIRELYSTKREAMLSALERHMDPAWGVRWTRPEGGLFLWMELPAGMSAGELLEAALEERIAFVLGRAFHCDGSGSNTLRLNFSYPTVEQLDIAIERLAKCIAKMTKRRPAGEGHPGVEVEPRLVARAAHSLDELAWNLALSELVE